MVMLPPLGGARADRLREIIEQLPIVARFCPIGPHESHDCHSLPALDRTAVLLAVRELVPVPPQPDKLLAELAEHLAKAERKHAPMRGEHEGWAVIYEELDELWDEVKRETINPAALRKEAFHTAAMALRFVKDVCDRQPDHSELWLFAWKCTTCGCMWRDTLDGFVSLFPNAHSCPECEMKPTKDACQPFALHVAEVGVVPPAPSGASTLAAEIVAVARRLGITEGTQRLTGPEVMLLLQEIEQQAAVAAPAPSAPPPETPT